MRPNRRRRTQQRNPPSDEHPTLDNRTPRHPRPHPPPNRTQTRRTHGLTHRQESTNCAGGRAGQRAHPSRRTHVDRAHITPRHRPRKLHDPGHATSTSTQSATDTPIAARSPSRTRRNGSQGTSPHATNQHPLDSPRNRRKRPRARRLDTTHQPTPTSHRCTCLRKIHNPTHHHARHQRHRKRTGTNDRHRPPTTPPRHA